MTRAEGRSPGRLARSLGGRLANSRIPAAAASLVGGQLIRMLGGVLFWSIAARVFPPAEVGIAAAAVAVMMISVQLALLGAGSSVIRLYPHASDGVAVVAAAFKVVFLASLAIGGSVVILSAFALGDLAEMGRSPVFAAAFIAACLLGACHGLAVEVSVAMARPSQVLAWAVTLSTVMLTFLGAWSLLSLPTRSDVIFSCWAAGELAACLLVVAQLGSARPRRAGRMIATARIRAVALRGVANHALTMADRVPPLLMTVVIAELLSPELSAYWYAVWMAAQAVFLIPLYAGMGLFAALVRERSAPWRRVRDTSLRIAGVAMLAAVAVFLLAGDLLRVLGPEYAAHGERPVQILVAGVFAVTFTQTYYAVCRATDRLFEATGTAMLAGGAAVIVGAWLARDHGLEAVAGAWIVSQATAAAWAVWRIRRLTALELRNSATFSDQPAGELDAGFSSERRAET